MHHLPRFRLFGNGGYNFHRLAVADKPDDHVVAKDLGGDDSRLTEPDIGVLRGADMLRHLRLLFGRQLNQNVFHVRSIMYSEATKTTIRTATTISIQKAMVE